MSKQVTAADLIRSVRAVADERPEFVYADQAGFDELGAGCSYVGPAIGNRDGEGCIVGRALERLDFDMEEVAEWENSSRSDGGSGIESLVDQFSIPGQPAEVGWLKRVQAGQDAGESWGAAVDEADAEQ